MVVSHTNILSLSQSRANPVDEVIPVESSVGSLIDVDSGVSVVESDFLEKEVTLAQKILSPVPHVSPLLISAID